MVILLGSINLSFSNVQLIPNDLNTFIYPNHFLIRVKQTSNLLSWTYNAEFIKNGTLFAYFKKIIHIIVQMIKMWKLL